MWFTRSYVSSIEKCFDSGILVCGMSTLWEYTYGCAKKYRSALAIYLMTFLSSLYGIIIYRAINSPGNENNVTDGINGIYKRYLK